MFTQALAARCLARGAQFLYGNDIVRISKADNAIESVAVYTHIHGSTGPNDAENELLLKAGAVVVACGSHSEPLLRSVGVNLPIYPGKS